MTPEMAAALASGRALQTAFYEIDLPSGTRRLLLGSTEVDWSGDTFVGFDPTIGSIDAPDEMREDMGGEAPNTSLTIAISKDADRAEIGGEDIQLSPFKVWIAALELDANDHLQVIPDPDMHFDGFIDQATFNIGKRLDQVEYSVISAFDYFFEDSEGQRLNGQFHRSVWPGETGLDNITGVTRKIYWGAEAPNTRTGSSSIGSVSGGGLGGFILGGAVSR